MGIKILKNKIPWIAIVTAVVGIVLGNVLGTESFGGIFNTFGIPRGKSLEQIARQKIADLHQIRNKLQKQSQQQQELQLKDENSKFDNETIKTETVTTERPGLEFRMAGIPVKLGYLKAILGEKKERDSFFAHIIPNSEVLLKVLRMRRNMDPNLSKYLARKFNNFLGNYGHTIGIPLFVIEAMKITPEKEMQWDFIEKLLENMSVTQLIQLIPDFKKPGGTTVVQSDGDGFNEQSLYEYVESRSLNAEIPKAEQEDQTRKAEAETAPESRSDLDIISDQEPDATVKGHKTKKYATYGIQLGKRQRLQKDAATASSNAYSSPDRTGYEYSSFNENYGLYNNDGYDNTYGKGYDDYAHGNNDAHSSTAGHSSASNAKGSKAASSASYGQATHYHPKSYGHGHSSGGYGGSGHGHGGGGGGYGGSGHGHGGGGYGSSGHGHGHGGGGYGSSGHGGGYGYGGGGGHGHGGGYGTSGGGYGGMMNGLLDPFSILGSLAFLTFLGLLFAQALAAQNATGRAFPSHIDPVFGAKKQLELTVLSFNSDLVNKVYKGERKNRRIRSLENQFLNAVEDMGGSDYMEQTWQEIQVIEGIPDRDCRQEKLCQLIQDVGDTELMDLFWDELEKLKEDLGYLSQLYQQSKIGKGLTCAFGFCT